MDIHAGKFYHLKDEFFSFVNDNKLMANKENGNLRPHFFFIADANVDGIYWAVPLSSRVEKYRQLIQQKINKYGRCNTIIIGKMGGQDRVFLIQNMFPVIEKYVDHEHTINGKGIKIHKTLEEQIRSNAKEVLNLRRRGMDFIFPDIDRIYSMLKDELLTYDND